MPLYSDFGLYYPGTGLPSYYGGGGAWGLPRPVVGLRFSPLLPPLAELGRRYSPLPPTRVSSPRRYLPPRPTYVDTADIDVVSPRINPVAGGLREIRRDRTLVRIHTSKVKDSPALQKARRKTPGERLVEKFLIRDKADEAKRKADEQKEKEKMLRDLAASAEADAPVIGGMSEADALDILLTSEEHKLAQDVRRKPTLKSLGSTKRKSKRRDSLPEEPDPESITGEVQRKPSLLQRRNTVKKRRNSQDLSLDLQAAVSSRRSSLASEIDPMEALMETEESGDKTPVLKFVVDEIRVEESPVSPRKFRYEIIVEDVPDDTTNELCKNEKPSDDLSEKAEISPKSFQISKCRIKKTKAVEKVSGDKTPDSSKPKVKAPISGKVASAAKKTVPSVTDGVRFPVTTAKNLKTIDEEANSLTSSSSLDNKTSVDRKSEAVSAQCNTGVAKSLANKDRHFFDSKLVGGEDNKRVQVSSKDALCVKKSKLSSSNVSPELAPVQIEVNVDKDHKTEQCISKVISTPISKVKQITPNEEKVVSISSVPADEPQCFESANKNVVLEKTEMKKIKTLTPVENVVDKTFVLPEPKSSANEQVPNLEKAQEKKLTDKISDQSTKLSSTNEQLASSEKTQYKLPKNKTHNVPNEPCSTQVQSNVLSPSPLPKSQEKKMKLLISPSANELDKTSELSVKCETVVKPKKSDVLETQSNTDMPSEKTLGKFSALKTKIPPKDNLQSSTQDKNIEPNLQISGEKTLGKVGALKTKIPPTESSVTLGGKNKEDQQKLTQDKNIESNLQISGEKTLGKVGALKTKIPPTESSVTVAVTNKEDQQTSTQDKNIESNLLISGEKTLGKVGALKAKIPATEESAIKVGVLNKSDLKTSTQGKHTECTSPTSALGKVGVLKTKILTTTESIVVEGIKIKDDEKASTEDKHIESNSQGSVEKSLGNVDALKINILPTTESIVTEGAKNIEDHEISTQGNHMECSSPTSAVGKVGALKTKILPTTESIVTEGVKNRDDQQVFTQESKNKNDVSPKLPPSQKSCDAVEIVSKTFPKINKKAVSNNSESVVTQGNEKRTAKTELKEEPVEEINFWAFIKGAEEEYVARPIFRTNSEPNRQKRDSSHVSSDVESKTGSSYSLGSPTLTDNTSLKPGVRGNVVLQKPRRDAGKSNAVFAKEQPKDSSTISSPNSPISVGPVPKGKNENASVVQNPTNLLSKPPVQPKAPKLQPQGAKIEGKTLVKADVGSIGTEATENNVKPCEKTNKKANEPLTKADLHTTVGNSNQPENSKKESESKHLLGTSNLSSRNDETISDLCKSKDVSNETDSETIKVSPHGKEDVVKKLNVKIENQRANLPRSPNDPLKKFNLKVNAESFEDISKKTDRKIENLKTNYPDKDCNSNSDLSNLLKSSKEMVNKSETSKLISSTSEVQNSEVNESELLKLKQSNTSDSSSEAVNEVVATLNVKENTVNDDKVASENISADASKKVSNNVPKKVVRKPKQLVKASKTTDLSHLQDALKIYKDEDKINVSPGVSSLTDDENKCANTAKSNTKFPGILPRRSKTPPAEKKATTESGQPLTTIMVKDSKQDLKSPSAKPSSETQKQDISPSDTETLFKQSQEEEPKTPKLELNVPSPDQVSKKTLEPPENNTITKKMEIGAANNALKTEEKNDKTKPLTSKTGEANDVNKNTSKEKQTADALKKIKKIHVEDTDSAAENKIRATATSAPDEIIKKQTEGVESVRNEVEVPKSKGNLTKLAVPVEKEPNAQIKIKPFQNKNVPKGTKLPELPKDVTRLSPCQDSVPKLNEKEMKTDATVKPKCANIEGKSAGIKTDDKSSFDEEINTAVNTKLDKTIQPKSEPLLKVKTGNNDNAKPKDKLVPAKEVTKKADNLEVEKKTAVSPTKDFVTKNKIITDTKEVTEAKAVEADIEKEEDCIKTSTPAHKEKKIAAGKEKSATAETGDTKPKVKKVIVKNKAVAKTETPVDNKKCTNEEKANEPTDKSKLEMKKETSSCDMENHNVTDTVKAEKLVSCSDVKKTDRDQGENKIVKDDKEPKKDALSKPKMGKAQKAKPKEDNKQVVPVPQTAKDEEKTEQDGGESQKVPEKTATDQSGSDKDRKESETEHKDATNATKTPSGRLFSDSESESSSQRTSTSSNDSGFDSLPDCDVNCHRKCEKLMPHLCGVNQKLIVEALRSVKRVPSTASDREGAPPLASNPALALDDGLGPKHPALTIPRFRKYGAEDFQFLKVLGKGSFGKVLLAELRGTERYYAVKCLKKDVVLEDNDVECTLIERKVLALGTRHPYLCHLFCTFQTESHLLFVLEYLNGGDLMFHIQQSGRFPEPRARFYAAEIVSGLKFLHKKGIVYRDLKLDNILLDYDGHIRIADFGMCKLQIFLDRMADTFCGTPDYMAPEIIKGLRYNQCVDWWSFGILLYEMLIGVSPFSGCDDNELFWSICNETPQYPRFLSQEAHNILLLLLEKDTAKRLGTPECPSGDVSDQPFFRPIDWFALERRELDPPFKPRVQHPLDVQYFDTTFTTERAQLTPVDKSILETMDQTQFEGFSYTNPYATD